MIIVGVIYGMGYLVHFSLCFLTPPTWGHWAYCPPSRTQDDRAVHISNVAKPPTLGKQALESLTLAIKCFSPEVTHCFHAWMHHCHMGSSNHKGPRYGVLLSAQKVEDWKYLGNSHMTKLKRDWWIKQVSNIFISRRNIRMDQTGC